MAQYSVHFFCNECGDVHPLGISIGLELDRPIEKESINNVYDGKELHTVLVKQNCNTFV